MSLACPQASCNGFTLTQLAERSWSIRVPRCATNSFHPPAHTFLPTGRQENLKAFMNVSTTAVVPLRPSAVEIEVPAVTLRQIPDGGPIPEPESAASVLVKNVTRLCSGQLTVKSAQCPNST